MHFHAALVSLSLALNPTEPPAAKEAAPAAKEAAPVATVAAMSFSEGFATPESVLYDAASDTYLVANISGSPLGADNDGFISRLSPEGEVLEAKWISGGQKGVTLNAPKGMGLAKGVLYVADLDTVRLFDAKTGKPKGAIKVPGATFLNDIAVGPDGKVYVSDSGLKAGEGGFEPSGTDAVYVLQGKKAKALAKGEALGRPNGLLATKGALHVVTFGSGELYTLTLPKGQKRGAVKLPKGALDGIVKAGDDFIVSSWDGKGLYRVRPDGSVTEMVSKLEAPADLGYDSKRQRVLVPLFKGNRVEAYDVK